MSSDITTSWLARYAGGQVQIQNSNKGYILVGEIATIVINEFRIIKMTFHWLAVGVYPSPDRWVKDDRTEYSVNINICNGYILRSDGGFEIMALIPGELVMIVPPGVTLLDKKQVVSLENKKVWSEAEIDSLWPQARRELIGLADHFEAKGASITALQIRMTLQLANERFHSLETKKD